MSVQQEPLKLAQTTAPAEGDRSQQPSNVEQPPRLEFNTQGGDESLVAYGSAVGGAILGVLLTLLVLAIINGGTLRFTDQGRLDAMQASLTQIDKNAGTINQNMESVAQRVETLENDIQSNLSGVQASLGEVRQTLNAQGIHLDELDDAVATLDVTRQQFSVLTGALVGALTEMGVIEAPAAQKPAVEEPAPGETGVAPVAAEAAGEEAVEPAAAEAVGEEAAAEEAAEPAAAEATREGMVDEKAAGEKAAEVEAGAAEATAEAPQAVEIAMPTVIHTTEVAADSVLVYLFVDEDADGVMGETEASLVGLTVAIQPVGDGEATDSVTVDTGALFEHLADGDYVVAVVDSLGFQLAVSDRVEVTVAAGSGEGQIVYFPVTAGETE